MKQLWSIKWVVLFTDIKNFTLKSSLLTQKQINILLNDQDKIIFPIIKKYFWKIIKSLWDSYMIVFEKPENAINVWIEIQNKILEYNSNIKLNLYKIELRITADYWNLDKNLSINWEDFLWMPVNIASRLQSITPENKFFISWELFNKIKDNNWIKYEYLWYTTFKWVLFNVDIYDILFSRESINIDNKKSINKKKIEKKFITDDIKLNIENIDNLIFKFASVAAILWMQPVPFLDIYALLPLHLYLLSQISKEYWIELSKDESKEIISTIMGSIAWGYLLSHWVVAVSKIGLFLIWWYLVVPLNFALTYSIWKVLSFYLYKKSKWVKSTNSELNMLFKYSITSWKTIAKNEKKNIISIWKKYKNDLLKVIKMNKKNFDSIINKKYK